MLTYFIIGQAWLINVVVPNTSVKPMKKQKVLGIPHYTKFFCFRTKVTYMAQSHFQSHIAIPWLYYKKSLQLFEETDYTWMKISMGTLRQSFPAHMIWALPEIKYSIDLGV